MKSMLVRFFFFDYFIQTKEIYFEHINDNFYETISGVLGKKNDKLTIRRNYDNTDKNIWRLLKYSNIQIKATLNIFAWKYWTQIRNFSLHNFAPNFSSVIRTIRQHKVPELRFKLSSDLGRHISENCFFSTKNCFNCVLAGGSIIASLN